MMMDITKELPLPSFSGDVHQSGVGHNARRNLQGPVAGLHIIVQSSNHVYTNG